MIQPVVISASSAPQPQRLRQWDVVPPWLLRLRLEQFGGQQLRRKVPVLQQQLRLHVLRPLVRFFRPLHRRIIRLFVYSTIYAVASCPGWQVKAGCHPEFAAERPKFFSKKKGKDNG